MINTFDSFHQLMCMTSWISRTCSIRNEILSVSCIHSKSIDSNKDLLTCLFNVSDEHLLLIHRQLVLLSSIVIESMNPSSNWNDTCLTMRTTLVFTTMLFVHNRVRISMRHKVKYWVTCLHRYVHLIDTYVDLMSLGCAWGTWWSLLDRFFPEVRILSVESTG
jgi:hypothetical protein